MAHGVGMNESMGLVVVCGLHSVNRVIWRFAPGCGHVPGTRGRCECTDPMRGTHHLHVDDSCGSKELH